MTRSGHSSIFFVKLALTNIVLLLLYNITFAQNPCYYEPELKVINASLGSSLNGPFVPNEELTIQLNIAWIGAGCNWLHGLVPTYGSAWSTSNFGPNGEIQIDDPLNDFSGNFYWYADHDIRYKNHESSEYEFDELLPSGWFMTNTTSGNSPFCSSNQYQWDPNCSCGIPQGCGGVREYTMIFKLTTQSYEECIANGSTDLSLQFKVFSDYESGSGPSAECIDVPIISRNWALACTDDLSLNIFPTAVFVPNNEPFEINIPDHLVTEQNPNYTYTWEPIDTWSIDGATSCDQSCGSVFFQTLSNGTSTSKEQKYLVKAIDENGVEGPATQWTVKVAASLSNNLDAEQNACINNEFTIPIQILGGAADGIYYDYDYLWSTGETTRQITVWMDEPATYSVTVTDEWETLVFTYNIGVVDPPEVNIVPELADDPCVGISPTAFSISSAISTIVHTWSGPGLDVETQHDSIIYPTTTGVYELSITDWSTGCTNEYEMLVHDASTIEVDLSISQQQVCRGLEPLDLFTVSPEGGILSGPLDANNHFIPDEIGVYTLTYTYVDPISQCTFEVSGGIEVIDANLPEMSWTHEPSSAYCINQTYTFCIDEVALSHSIIWQTSDELAIVEPISENCVEVTWANSNENNSVCVEYYTADNCLSPKLCVDEIVVLDEVDCFAVGVNEIKTDYQIYPNPTNNTLNIESSTKVDVIRMFDVLGRLVLERNTGGNTFYQLDVSYLETGIYKLVIDEVGIETVILY